ncbi:MAG: hypothetical protein DRG82_07655 [Deltaproteobacteria bacterium]|nr:MAG: hypothetical protein DRG82_07655 [Deltaproteobacteria bacterium]
MEEEILAAGASVISDRKEARLESYLGSCVGVTIVDKEGGVGGMLHLLLPEPSGADVDFEPDIYATTGVPRFLELLFGRGALKDRAVACIAGGALVGQTFDADPSMDIGGQTAEAVQGCLEKNGIFVEKSETGGLFNRKMVLDLRSLSTTIEPIWQTEDSADANVEKEVNFNIERAIEAVKPIPQVALKIMRMIERDDYTMSEVGKEIRQDQVISGKVLNFCNSAVMGFRDKIDSIDRAVVVLGEKRLLEMVISASVESSFAQSAHGYSLCKGGIYQHALGTAMIAQEIAAFSGKAAKDIAYTAGLLHDIGKIPLDQFMAVNAPLFYRKIQREGIELCEIEKMRFGIDHAQAGKLLGAKWDLPRNLIDVIANHHCPEKSEEDEELVTVVHIADLLMSRFQVRHELDFIDTERLAQRLARIGLSTEQYPVLVDRIPRNIFRTGSSST